MEVDRKPILIKIRSEASFAYNVNLCLYSINYFKDISILYIIILLTFYVKLTRGSSFTFPQLNCVGVDGIKKIFVQWL